ncbi:AMP-binding enzyme [Kutzneria kofuensis]|uniref:AMP-binding enzyme n=1 Tax=Kutzneria kofuensis TaxID=103725 RepID=UPI0031E82266
MCIICGGQNVHPLEIESVLLESPSVRDVLVAGRPDDMVGQVPSRHIVPADDGFDPDALRQLCLRRLSLHKVPVAFEIADMIPRHRVREAAAPAVRGQAWPRGCGAHRDRGAVRSRRRRPVGERPFTDLGLTSMAGVQCDIGSPR